MPVQIGGRRAGIWINPQRGTITRDGACDVAGFAQAGTQSNLRIGGVRRKFNKTAEIRDGAVQLFPRLVRTPQGCMAQNRIR